MGAKSRYSLRISLAGVLLGVVLVTSLSLGAATFSLWRRSLRNDLQTRLRAVAGTTALLVDPVAHAGLHKAEDMSTHTYTGLRDRLAAVRRIVPDVHFLYTLRWTEGEAAPRFVLDTGTGSELSPLGKTYPTPPEKMRAAFQPPFQIEVEDGFYTDEYGTFLSAYAPILGIDGKLEAILGVDIDASQIGALERRLLFIVSALTVAIALAIGIGAWWLSRWFSHPLRALSADAERIQRLDLDAELAIDSSISEIVAMQDGFANMKRGLRSFRKYVPRELVAQLISLQKEATLGTERAEVTVLFCDLASFTTASEALSGEALAALLGSYFGFVTRALQAEGATVDKFIGDAVMAFWNAPVAQADHAARAARAALAIERGMASLRSEWAARGLPPLGVRIGVNSGQVQVGNVGHQDRLSYTVLGDPVNLASRLESLNKHYGTTLLFSETTRRAVGDQIGWRPIDVVAVKGKAEAIEVDELAEAPPAWWTAYRAAWELYRAGRWAEAAQGFDAVRTDTGIDPVSQVLARRCHSFATSGPPPGWTGAWIMQDK